MVMTREEVFRGDRTDPGITDTPQAGSHQRWQDHRGEAWLAYESGAFPGMWAMLGCMCVVSSYNVDNFVLEGFEVVVNKPVNAAYRAPSAPMAAFATDTLIDEIAERLGMDPIELRLLNCPDEGDVAPYGPKWPKIGLRECLEAIRDSDHYRSAPGWRARPRCGHRLLVQHRRGLERHRQPQRERHRHSGHRQPRHRG